jgi:hypothetical protein
MAAVAFPVGASQALAQGSTTTSTSTSTNTGIDSYIEMLRTDVANARKSLADAALNLPDDKATAFWPVYRNYQLEADAWGDKRLALIKDYAANFDKMTDAKASELAKQVFANQKSRTTLLEKYYKEFSKVIGPSMAARAIQVELAINNLIDLQIATELPLFPAGAVPPAAEAKK